jgi:hypothetical protein
MYDFNLSPLVYLAVIGLVAILLGLLVAPFGLWWIWNHVSITVH